MGSESFELMWPWVFVLLPLPLLVYFFIPAAKSGNDDALWTPFFDRLSNHHADQASASQSNPFMWLLLALIWLTVLLAASRPHMVSDEMQIPSQTRDILLAVDISGSMDEADMRYQNTAIRRIDLVKQLLGDFIERRQGDRLGLIVFGTKAFLHAPLTFDLKTISQYLDELELGYAGKDTAIGDALGLSIKTLRKRPSEQRILILLTDGSNTAGTIDALEAANMAHADNVKIYTIGIGSDGQSNSVFGQLFNITRGSELDEVSLKEIAKRTNGQYFRAKNSDELESIYQLLDELEPVEHARHSFKLQRSLSHYPLLFAMLLLSAIALFYLFRGRASKTHMNKEAS
ncbi:MAG: VWA domain-containing protein [Pseudomonadota bacterium]